MIETFSIVSVVLCVIAIIGMVVHDTYKLWRKNGNSDDTIASLIRRSLDDTMPSHIAKQLEETIPERYQQLLDASMPRRLWHNFKYQLFRLKRYLKRDSPTD